MSPLNTWNSNEQNPLVTAQKMFAEIYGNNYPFSKTVEQGLQRVLGERYNGSPHEFMNNFILPTATLLKKAEAKGFPLVKGDSVIIHLVAPTNHLENGEMFYQVGHTSPGVLAVKFTKYVGKNVIQQPGNIDGENLHEAFTQRYVETLRGEAPNLGDQLMRILLTSKESAAGDYDVEKVEAKKTMPRSLEQSLPCHLPVTETAMPKSPGADEQPVLARSCSEDRGTSCIVTGQDCPFQESFSLRNKDLSSSLLAQPPSGDHMASAFPSQHQEQLGENMSYPEYPPLLQAVKYDTEEPDIGGHTSQDGQSKAKYPPILQAVRNEVTEGPDSRQPNGEESCEAGQGKAKYPPIFEAARNETEEPNSCQPNGEQSCEAGQRKVRYPPILQAVRNETKEPDSSQPNGEQSFEAGQGKAKYPPIFEAARNETEEPDSSQPNGEQPFEAGQSKVRYPPLCEAARNETEEPDTGQPCGEHSRLQSSFRYGNNPPYSSLSPASGNVQTPTPSTTTSGSEPYPPLVQAVNDQQVTRATGQLPPLTTTPTGGTGTYREDEDLDLF
ncbi:PREDICTED: uncharacterized protein LOC107345068 isoform X1 [Acropora digitifera]|uniref:uncharacterized protein LOC107345068 isoform X1 n=1 Tax=Acropora digitifera TaxID=70779 RepID=UPI00077AF3D7|nr:PREDICTED: uncharacterized protein LOC107345068 isoform X1 [Acropora digitifera]